jgi:hypothetical protein
MSPEALKLPGEPARENFAICLTIASYNDRVVMTPDFDTGGIEYIYPLVVSMRVPAQHD